MGGLERLVDGKRATEHRDAGIALAACMAFPRRLERRVDETLPKLLPPRARRVGVGIVGQEVARVELDCLGAALGRPRGGRPLERVDIHPDAVDEAHHATIDPDELRPHDLPEVVERAMKVVRPGLEILVRPQAIDHLFPMQRVAARERHRGEELHRTPLAPRARRNLDGDGVDDLHREAPEHVDSRLAHIG
jgi:hypothetical protein